MGIIYEILYYSKGELLHRFSQSSHMPLHSLISSYIGNAGTKPDRIVARANGAHIGTFVPDGGRIILVKDEDD